MKKNIISFVIVIAFLIVGAFLVPTTTSYDYEVVTVQPNDTIWQLVSSRNRSESKCIEELVFETVKVNGFENGSRILQPGEKIKIPVVIE